MQKNESCLGSAEFSHRKLNWNNLQCLPFSSSSLSPMHPETTSLLEASVCIAVGSLVFTGQDSANASRRKTTHTSYRSPFSRPWVAPTTITLMTLNSSFSLSNNSVKLPEAVSSSPVPWLANICSDFLFLGRECRKLKPIIFLRNQERTQSCSSATHRAHFCKTLIPWGPWAFTSRLPWWLSEAFKNILKKVYHVFLDALGEKIGLLHTNILYCAVAVLKSLYQL